MTTEFYANKYQTTLSASLTSIATTCTVTSVVGIPARPFRMFISAEGANTNEIVLVTGLAGSTLTITRAAEAVAGVSAASAHASGAVVAAVLTAAGIADIATPSFATPSVTLGTAAAAGASGSTIRADATIVAFDATLPAPTTPGSLGTVGSAGVAARRDHVHNTPGGMARIVAAAAIANTETVVCSASLPANYMAAGTTFRLTAIGRITTGATGGTSIFRIRIGTTTLTGNIPATLSVVNANSVTNAPLTIDALVTVRTNGASGTAIGQIRAMAQTAAPIAFTSKDTISAVTATVVVDTTATKLVEFTYISGNAGSTLTFEVASLEVVNLS